MTYENNEIKLLKEKFDKIEFDSLIVRNSDENEFLCFRLDGIKHNKLYLKKRLVNETYVYALSKAIESTYFLYRNQTPLVFNNFFCCAFFASDEVSFVLNKGCNYYNNRVFKIGTMLAGTLSSAMTIRFEMIKTSIVNDKKKEWPSNVGFDSRPLVLKTNDDVKAYIQYRWLVACRNAASKVLRLESDLTDEELYETKLSHNFVALMEKIEQLVLYDSYKKIVNTFFLYVPDDERNFKKITIKNHHHLNDILFHAYP